METRSRFIRSRSAVVEQSKAVFFWPLHFSPLLGPILWTNVVCLYSSPRIVEIVLRAAGFICSITFFCCPFLLFAYLTLAVLIYFRCALISSGVFGVLNNRFNLGTLAREAWEGSRAVPFSLFRLHLAFAFCSLPSACSQTHCKMSMIYPSQTAAFARSSSSFLRAISSFSRLRRLAACSRTALSYARCSSVLLGARIPNAPAIILLATAVCFSGRRNGRCVSSPS